MCDLFTVSCCISVAAHAPTLAQLHSIHKAALLHCLQFSFFMEALNAFCSSCAPSRESFYTSTEASELFFQEACFVFFPQFLFLGPAAEPLQKTCIYIFMWGFCLCVIYTLLYSTSRHEHSSVQGKLWTCCCVGKIMSSTPAHEFYPVIIHCLASVRSSLET